MSISVSLPDSLKDFLEEEMRTGGDESLDACACALLQRAEQVKPRRREFEVDGRTYRLTRLSDSQEDELRRKSILIDTTSSLACLQTWPGV